MPTSMQQAPHRHQIGLLCGGGGPTCPCTARYARHGLRSASRCQSTASCRWFSHRRSVHHRTQSPLEVATQLHARRQHAMRCHLKPFPSFCPWLAPQLQTRSTAAGLQVRLSASSSPQPGLAHAAVHSMACAASIAFAASSACAARTAVLPACTRSSCTLHCCAPSLRMQQVHPAPVQPSTAPVMTVCTMLLQLQISHDLLAMTYWPHKHRGQN